MPAVKPPEWKAMSANEQLLWYLKRLCATAEEMSLVLGVASTGDPPVVTPLVDPAASTTTHGSSAPVPDVSGSTTKAQEVLEVDTMDSVDEIHDAATTVHLKSVVDLNDKEVEQPFSAPATTSSTTSSTMPRALASTTAVECQEGLAAVHDTSTESITMASMTCSMNCSNQGMTALSLTTPIATGSLLPTVTLALVADPNRLAPNADRTMRAPLAMKDELLKTPSPRMLFVVNAMQSFMNHDLDVSPPTRHEGLPITPWPSFRVHHSAEGNEVRPTPWPSFSCSHEGMTLNHKGLLSQVTCVMKIPIGVPSEETADSDFCVQLFGQVKKIGVLSTQLFSNLGLQLRLFESLLSAVPAIITVHCLISMVPRDTSVLIQPIMQVMGDLALDVVEWRLVICSMAAYLVQSMQQMGAPSTRCLNNIFLQFMRIGPYELGCVAVVYLLEDYLRPVIL